MSKARIISTSGFLCRAFGEQEDEGNSVGSNSLGGALADYNMQVRNTKNLTFLHCVFSNVFVFNTNLIPRISMFSTTLTRISLTGHPLHASSLLREDEEAEACDRSVPQHQKSGLLVGRQV